MFYKIGVLKIFAKFTEKRMYWSLFFDKIAGLQTATLLKERLRYRCFPVSFAKFLRTRFSNRTPPVIGSDYIFHCFKCPWVWDDRKIEEEFLLSRWSVDKLITNYAK